MQQQLNQVLALAISRNVGIVLSLPSAGMLRHYKSRFIGQDGCSFLVESVPSEQALIDTLINSRQPAGISFKAGHTKLMFATPILGCRADHRINADTAVDALTLLMPANIKAIQRRGNYRVRISENPEMSLRVWRISAHSRLSDRPQSAQEISAQIRDLSIGGVGVTLCGTENEPPRVSEEDRLRLQLDCNGQTLLLEGKMRTPHAAPKHNQIITGIQFQGMEKDLHGRQTLARLTRIVGELQREEIRRTRMGMVA